MKEVFHGEILNTHSLIFIFIIIFDVIFLSLFVNLSGWSVLKSAPILLMMLLTLMLAFVVITTLFETITITDDTVEVKNLWIKKNIRCSDIVSLKEGSTADVFNIQPNSKTGFRKGPYGISVAVKNPKYFHFILNTAYNHQWKELKVALQKSSKKKIEYVKSAHQR